MNALHSKVTPEWYTPAEYVEAARAVMGAIDLDPASCWKANEVVKATEIHDKSDNGLSWLWHGRVFLNPPGGLVREFWRTLLAEHMYGDVPEAVWMGYSLQQLQTLQSNNEAGPVRMAASICYPRKRIAFLDATGTASKRPTHANYIAYLGPSTDTFAIHFSQFGEVRKGRI